ncbi:hypothetical protein CBI38_24645 [Rhodococcus oxybenzonivorans]|uniref:Uncharacterized protein n=1 Tax=Rhodococcus oxybenzonivorans TaxID=1990687 RepID=A0A2S2C061_9NOCA|nr:hypothetical protein [Rhodococcus oxybenzonivorans]AWK74267.1 hypothetical protein CBI38_24645 [Rhodococcus oxybenzonivorans]
MKHGTFAVRALFDHPLGCDVVSIKSWTDTTSWNVRMSLDDAEDLGHRILSAVQFARHNDVRAANEAA